jgi:hypothetical protein
VCAAVTRVTSGGQVVVKLNVMTKVRHMDVTTLLAYPIFDPESYEGMYARMSRV